jgi:hypothetical protein
MKNFLKTTKTSIENIIFRISYSEGLDKEYDALCKKEFLDFIDNVYYAFVSAYLIFATASAYYVVDYWLTD